MSIPSSYPSLKQLAEQNEEIGNQPNKNAQAYIASVLCNIPISVFISRKECSKSGAWRAKQRLEHGQNPGCNGKPQSLSTQDEKILVSWVRKLIHRGTIVYTSVLVQLVSPLTFYFILTFIYIRDII